MLTFMIYLFYFLDFIVFSTVKCDHFFILWVKKYKNMTTYKKIHEKLSILGHFVPKHYPLFKFLSI